jgi:hypothetical protein
VPVFSYFLIVGSVLTGLLFYADSVMVARPLPFSVSQKIGLPESYKTQVVVAEVPKLSATNVEPPVVVKKPVEAARKHKTARVVRRLVPQQSYAAYPIREHGSIW